MKHLILILAALLGLASIASADPPRIGRHAALADSAAEHPELPPLNSRVRLSMLPDSTAEESDKRRVIIHSGDEDDDWDEWDDDHRYRYGRYHHELNLTAEARYTRIEGVAISLGFERPLNRATMTPAYHLMGGYAFVGQFGKFNVGFEQPLVGKNKLTLGVEGYRKFTPTFYGDEVISTGENSASMLFLKKEYRDWYETQGGRAFVGIRPSPFMTLHVGIQGGQEKSVPTATRWSVFNQQNPIADNPTITDGDYFGYFAEAAFDSRPRSRPDKAPYSRSQWSTIEHHYRLLWERSDPSAGDFDEWRMVADLRTYLRVARRQNIWVRLLAGTSHGSAGVAGDELSAQRRFVLGGVGTMRGQNFRTLVGNNAAMANVEYSFAISRSLSAMFLMDAGNAWDDGNLFDQHILVDLGTGIRLGDRGVSLEVAKNVNHSDSDVKVLFRLEDTF